MKRINDLFPKIPGLKWGAVTNMYPTNRKIMELNKIFKHDGEIHEVFYGKDFNYIDGHRIAVHGKERWT